MGGYNVYLLVLVIHYQQSVGKIGTYYGRKNEESKKDKNACIVQRIKEYGRCTVTINHLQTEESSSGYALQDLR